MHKQYVIKRLPARLIAQFFYVRKNILNTYIGRLKSKASLYRWHQRFRHIGPEPLKRILIYTERAIIILHKNDEIRTTGYIAYAVSKAHRKIIRQARSEVTKAKTRLAIDFYEYNNFIISNERL